MDHIDEVNNTAWFGGCGANRGKAPNITDAFTGTKFAIHDIVALGKKTPPQEYSFYASGFTKIEP